MMHIYNKNLILNSNKKNYNFGIKYNYALQVKKPKNKGNKVSYFSINIYIH